MRVHPSFLYPTLKGSAAGNVVLLILVGLCAVAAHQATYFFGAPAAGSVAGAHDGYWGPFSAIVVLASTGLAAVAFRELRRLSAHAAHVAPAVEHRSRPRAFFWAQASLWFRLSLTTIAFYVAQENVERLAIGAELPGLDAVVAHGLLPVLIILGTSFLVALVATLVRWHCDVLLWRLARARVSRLTRRARSVMRARSARVPRHDILHARGSRAPPIPSTAI